jgi:hypothetical protein
MPTDQEIIEIAEGATLPDQEEPQQEDQMAQGEETTTEELEEEQDNEAEEVETKEEQGTQEPKKRTLKDDMIRARRRAQEAEAREREKDALLAKEREEKRVLQEFIRNFAKENGRVADESEDDEPIDKEHFDRIEKSRAQDRVETKLEIEDAKGIAAFGYQNYNNLKTQALYREALEIGELAIAAGEELSEQQLLERASREFERKTRAIADGGRSVVQYIAARAGQFAERTGTLKQADKQSGGRTVNIEAVDRARRQAGAAEVKRTGNDAADYSLEAQLAELDRKQSGR